MTEQERKSPMKAAKKVDMTQGSIMKRVLLFALPICVGNVLQQLYGTVDTLVICLLYTSRCV